MFADKSFKQGPPLESSEREFKIKNVPNQECIIVCVVTLEDINVTPESVPFSQCREIRTLSSQTSNIDKITIAASAAICGTIIVAVIIFITAGRRRSRKMQSLNQLKNPLPMGGLPINCCGPAGSPGPLGSIATLSAFNNHKVNNIKKINIGENINATSLFLGLGSSLCLQRSFDSTTTSLFNGKS